MRNLKLYLPVLTLAGLINVSLGAQQTAGTLPSQLQPADAAAQHQPDAAQKSNQRAVAVTSTASAPEVNNGRLRPVAGILENKVDSATAKAGDAVIVRTTDKASTAGGVVIPTGSKIMGRVVDAQPAGNASGNAKVTVVFDRAQLTSGKSLPIKSVLQSVNTAAEESQTMGGTAAVAPADRADGRAVRGSMSSIGGSAPTGKNATGTVVSRQGDVTIETTGVPGVLLAANADGQPFANASGALIGNLQNVHLEDGTHIVLAVADAGTRASKAK
ncbi:hypothetical protein [Occallatibacter riparius]|uniref:DUF5666 domain-containing protein n=1 Tax=Occallatibacter riparius TaxID=1002689 RepID=A0A9J7BR93_9BACT|nr:hypothetical protein [Occallatibacter riparius]UWZ84274.1 hypothetical protein MOP44_27475 [Occallatibacter riparius]